MLNHKDPAESRQAQAGCERGGIDNKPPSFDQTPQFEAFTKAMRGIVTVSKAELDARIEESKRSSPRNNNPYSPGKKKVP